MKYKKVDRWKSSGPWPLFLILVLDGIAVGYSWLIMDEMNQNKVIWTISAQVIAFMAGLVWLAFFSKFKAGKAVSLAILSILALLVAIVEIREVSGDLVPILAWRWSPKPHATLPATSTSSVAMDELDRRDSQAGFPQFLGPDRNGMIDGVSLARDWHNNPPRELWRQPIGAGWSGFAVAGALAVTQEQRGEEEMVSCYDLASGRLLWAHAHSYHFDTVLGGEGPRATPTISRGRVYAMGAGGMLHCLDLSTGGLIWQRDTAAEHAAALPEWGFCASPLAIGERVVVSPGGDNGRLLAAYHWETGKLLWTGGYGKLGYSSPQLRELDGIPQIIVFNIDSLAGHDPETGRELWRTPWPSNNSPTAANPLLLPDGRLLVSSGYGVGCALYKIQQSHEGGFEAQRLYTSTRLKAKFAHFVSHDGSVYGLDDGVLTCMDPDNGERRWKAGRYGHGQMLLVEDLILLQSERGRLFLIEANPEELRELGGIDALHGKAWNTLALAGDKLLMRSHKEALCLALPTSASQTP